MTFVPPWQDQLSLLLSSLETTALSPSAGSTDTLFHLLAVSAPASPSTSTCASTSASPPRCPLSSRIPLTRRHTILRNILSRCIVVEVHSVAPRGHELFPVGDLRMLLLDMPFHRILLGPHCHSLALEVLAVAVFAAIANGLAFDVRGRVGDCGLWLGWRRWRKRRLEQGIQWHRLQRHHAVVSDYWRIYGMRNGRERYWRRRISWQNRWRADIVDILWLSRRTWLWSSRALEVNALRLCHVAIPES